MATGTVADWISNLADYGLGDDITSDDLLSIINGVIADVNSRQAWPFLETTASVNTVAGTAQVTLPTRFSKARGIVIDALSWIVTPERRDTILKQYAGYLTQQGTPINYYFIGQNMYLYPVPDQIYALTMDYTQDEVQVTAATSLASLLMPFKHQSVYMWGIIQQLYALEDDTELYNLFGQRFEKKIVDMMEDIDMHQYDMPDRIVDVWDDGVGGAWG